MLVLLGILFASPAFARDYKVEMLVFKNLQDSRAYEPHHYTAPEQMTSNGETWKIEPSMLLEEAEAINNSSDYELLYHYSWAQESLPSSQSASYRLSEPLLNGWVKVYATQLLFANIDVDFDGYRMQEQRRLKLNEKHFFDHPKFGFLLQVSRLEPGDNEESSLSDSSSSLSSPE